MYSPPRLSCKHVSAGQVIVRAFRLLLAVCCAAATAACAVGPDFERPAPPADTSYDAEAPMKTAQADDAYGASQYLAPGEPLPAAWWTLYRSAPLNDLITEAVLNNPDLEAAKAALNAAQEDLAAGEGQLFPTIGAGFSSTREKLSGASFGGDFPSSIFTLHNASVSLSYGVDIFGGTRRAIEESGGGSAITGISSSKPRASA